MARTVSVIADNIISPLGMSSQQNYESVLQYRSEVRLHADIEGLAEPAMVSMLDKGCIAVEASRYSIPESFTFFETMVALSIRKALENADVDATSHRTGIVLSTTKGNVSLLDLRQDYRKYSPENDCDREQRSLVGESALRIASYLGNPNTPLVVSNACISGVCAEIVAARQIADGAYDDVIVCGCDVQGLFIISGFQSFKAISSNPCRPFDSERDGLNLGEAASTVILSGTKNGKWHIAAGAIRNDANHISGPSRTGEGSFRCLDAIYSDKDVNDLAFVGVHGTSTLYNDEMESIALSRAGMSDVPLNALKGNFGHTMGSAGVLESIISMKAAENGVVLATKGFQSMGVSCPVNISAEHRKTDRRSFIKLLSGFGGCNAAALFTMDEKEFECDAASKELETIHEVVITPESIVLDGAALPTEGEGKQMLDAAFKNYVGGYAKYYKMDTLSRLGFLASELLLKDDKERFSPRDDRAVVLFGSTSSLCNDRNYQATIQDPQNYFPSPALFVYTLANIVTGEIAIRNKYLGETSFYILPAMDEDVMTGTLKQTFMDKSVGSAVTGWLDCRSDSLFEARLKLVRLKK